MYFTVFFIYQASKQVAR